MTARSSLVLGSLASICVAFALACSSGPPPKDDKAAAAPARSGGPAGPSSAEAKAGGADAGGPIPRGPEFTEGDFVESDRNRDPFRSFAGPVDPSADKGTKPTIQYTVKLAEYSIDELRLAAIVLAGDGGRAMFIDPGGKGHIIVRGDYIGKPDLVRVGGSNGPEFQVHWRVDRIREGDIVFIRTDKTNPNIPPATRVMVLHPEAEKLRQSQQPG